MSGKNRQLGHLQRLERPLQLLLPLFLPQQAIGVFPRSFIRWLDLNQADQPMWLRRVLYLMAVALLLKTASKKIEPS
jgi:hypothetical protein